MGRRFRRRSRHKEPEIFTDRNDQVVKKSRRGHRMCATHVLECIEKIQFIYRIDPHLENTILYDATIRNLQTMAESARYLKKEIRENHPEISWKLIRRLRNDLVHGYLATDVQLAAKALIEKESGLLQKILERAYPDWKKEKKRTDLPVSKFSVKQSGVSC